MMLKERTVEHDKQMPLRFEPSVFPTDAVSSDRASEVSSLTAPEQSTSARRTAVILKMHVAPNRGRQATQERDSDLLDRILNRVKLF